MPLRVARSQATRYVVSPLARSTSLTVPAQPPSGMSAKSGSRTPCLTHTLSPTSKRGDADGFLGLAMLLSAPGLVSYDGLAISFSGPDNPVQGLPKRSHRG